MSNSCLSLKRSERKTVQTDARCSFSSQFKNTLPVTKARPSAILLLCLLQGKLVDSSDGMDNSLESKTVPETWL